MRLTGGIALGGDGDANGPVKAASPLVIIYARDLAETQRRVEEAGGKSSNRRTPSQGGRFHFADPDGYELAVWSDK